MTRVRSTTPPSREAFSDRYGKPLSDADVLVEKEVCGTEEGVCGYATLDQANMLRTRLDLRPGARLLDVGAGRGWPGLYLAETTGCEVVISDLHRPALADGLVRARTKRIHTRTSSLLAEAASLPFRDNVFDAVVHTDVL